MAGDPGAVYYIMVKPNTLTDLSVAYKINTDGPYTLNLSSFSVSGDYLSCCIGEQTHAPTITSLSSTGYKNATITNDSVSPNYYTYINFEEQFDLYAWTSSSSTTIYTKSETPTVNTMPYNADGTVIYDILNKITVLDLDNNIIKTGNDASGYTTYTRDSSKDIKIDDSEEEPSVSDEDDEIISPDDILYVEELEDKEGKVYIIRDKNASTYHPPILSCMWSDHIINDIQWLRADTFSWQSGDVYTTAYDKLVEEYSTGAEETEGSITFKRTSNGFKIATANQETVILNKYNTEGIAWYYILDTTNKRFKLPRTKFGFEGLRTNAGDDIAESLPNIKGTMGLNSAQGFPTLSNSTGAFYNTTTSYNRGTQNVASSGSNLNFDASRSSSTYQDNAPVQERATQMYLYFYVGEFAQTSIEQTAGITTEQLNGKVDLTGGTMTGQLEIKYDSPSILLHYPNKNWTRIEQKESGGLWLLRGRTETDICGLNGGNGIYLKTCYVNGTSGYNIWTNGYCEQWGYLSGSPSSDGVTVTLPKTFSNTSYSVICSISYSEISTAVLAVRDVVNSRGTNTIRFLTTYATANGAGYAGYTFSWKASGYLAAGQY